MEIEKIHKIMSKYYRYSYPIYSGTTIECLECGLEYFLTGQEFKDNIGNGLRRILLHSGACDTHNRLTKELNEADTDTIYQASVRDIIHKVRIHMMQKHGIARGLC